LAGNRKGKWVQIVGVALNGKYFWVGEPPTEYLYLGASCKIPDAQNVVLVAQSTLLCKGALFRPPRQEFSPFRHSSTEVSSLPVFGLAAVAVGAP
jgi:hypothetical protein